MMFQGGKTLANKQPRKISGKLKPIDLDESVTVRRWLARNSLRALKLTILDALEPTLVKQTPEHVKILDKYVESKVWNDVSPQNVCLSVCCSPFSDRSLQKIINLASNLCFT